ncbi:MAG: signal peptidase [Planctomycetaceae bacterium]|jgi:cell fate regulator YaaT (PSP1 superfamily)|nr:signal peptidase [Planctomycetaceae bacterium]
MNMIKYIVRYGAMRILGVFTYPEHTLFQHGQRVIVRTLRGQESGTVLCPVTPESLAEMKGEWVEDRVIRPMTEADEIEYRRLLAGEKEEFICCRNIIRKMNIVMDLVRVEHIFGGERIIVYYVAEGRVDFRELVKVLASEFQTRIEMRQIGVRDETKLLADFGDCGKEVCCNRYLTEMPPVSMKMAKLQKATLDPTKISGRCGRLKCCLRYEYDHYIETQKELPPIGCRVRTEEGEGHVVGQEILARKVMVEINDHGRKMFCPKSLHILDIDPPEKTKNNSMEKNEKKFLNTE